MSIDKKTKSTIFNGNVVASDPKNNVFKADFAEYKKNLQLLKSKGKTTILSNWLPKLPDKYMIQLYDRKLDFSLINLKFIGISWKVLIIRIKYPAYDIANAYIIPDGPNA